MNCIQTQLLNIIANHLFNAKKEVLLNGIDDGQLLREALMQTVQPLVFQQIKNELPPEHLALWNKHFNGFLHKAMMIEYQHVELEQMLREYHIPCVFIKGCASGHYYPESALRCYGDVDVLVRPEDMDRVGKILVQSGFHPEAEDDGFKKHIAYQRNFGEIWEVHRFPCNLPSGSEGTLLEQRLSDLMDTAVEIQTPSGKMHIPDAFHHGLVVLIHNASHLTSEGIGLRHLCDWAVFVNQMPDFESLDRELLEQCGLWTFADLMTQVAEKYLGLPKQSWTSEASPELLEALLEDILSGGNFGNKVENRHAQIKYIKNYDQGKLGKQSVIMQAWNNLRSKAKGNNRSVIAEMIDYLKLVRNGERRFDNKKVVDAANQRNRLYQELKLFQSE